MSQPLLEVRGVWKRLCRRPDHALRYALADIGREIMGRSPEHELRDGEFWAIQDVSLTIAPGQVLGVIGHNGAGKSTLINLVSGVIQPTAGSIVLRTDRVAVIDHGGGLNPVETGRENAATQLALHGHPEDRVGEELEAVAAFAEIGSFFDAPVGTYSLGMRQRLAFSIYTRLEPDLFIVDEAIGGGDLRFRNRFRAYLRSYIDEGGAMLLCSHEMPLIQAFCHECALLDEGRTVLSGEPVIVIDRYHTLAEAREAEAGRKRAGGSGLPSADGRPRPRLDDRCEIESVVVRAEDGGTVRPGGSAVIEVGVRVLEAINGVACAIEIGRGELEAVATLPGGFPPETFSLRPPRTVLRCRIERIPLAPGNYDVHVILALPISGETLAYLGYGDATVTFSVVAEVDRATNLARQRQNIVHVEAEWHIAPHEGAIPACDEAGDPDQSAMPSGESPPK